PCINNPDIQEYLVSLFSDLAANYDLDFIQTCLVLFGPGHVHSGSKLPQHSWQRLVGVAAGGCFCDACKAKAEGEGLNWSAIVEETAHLARIAGKIGHEAEHERLLL